MFWRWEIQVGTTAEHQSTHLNYLTNHNSLLENLANEICTISNGKNADAAIWFLLHLEIVTSVKGKKIPARSRSFLLANLIFDWEKFGKPSKKLWKKGKKVNTEIKKERLLLSLQVRRLWEQSRSLFSSLPGVKWVFLLLSSFVRSLIVCVVVLDKARIAAFTIEETSSNSFVLSVVSIFFFLD